MKLSSKKSFFFLVLFLPMLFYFYRENREVQLRIPTSNGHDLILLMPLKDRNNLEYLFRSMVAWDVGGYTLFGCKSMHMNGFIKPLSTKDWRLFCASITPPNLRKYRAWETWEKYRDSFEKENPACLMWSEKNPFWREPHPAMSILLVNKQRLFKTVKLHFEDFQTVLHREKFSAEDLLADAKIHPFLKTVLKNHNGLIGILFGFGRDNAWLFEEREKGKNKVPLTFLWIDDEEICSFLQNIPNKAWWWGGWFPYDLSEILSYPTFLADINSIETKELKQEFISTRRKILNYYEGKDFLEASLTLFMLGPTEISLTK